MMTAVVNDEVMRRLCRYHEFAAWRRTKRAERSVAHTVPGARRGSRCSTDLLRLRRGIAPGDGAGRLPGRPRHGPQGRAAVPVARLIGMRGFREVPDDLSAWRPRAVFLGRPLVLRFSRRPPRRSSIARAGDDHRRYPQTSNERPQERPIRSVRRGTADPGRSGPARRTPRHAPCGNRDRGVRPRKW